jgi:hypothetical protein
MPRSRRHILATLLTLSGFLAGWAWLGLILNLPANLGDLFGPDQRRMSVEATAGLVLLALWGRPLGRGVRRFAAAALLFLVVMRLADLAARTLIGRPVDLSLDIPLLPSILEVLTAAATPLELTAAIVLVPAALIALYFLNRAALGIAEHVLTAHRRLSAALLAAPILLSAAGLQLFAPLSHGAFALLADQAGRLAQASRVHADYRAELARDDVAALPPDGILAGLGGRNLYLIFVESYGETVLTDPRYAPTIAPALADIESGLRTHGFHARSGRMLSPIAGGQSWLAHSTLLSGTRIDNQSFYNRMLTSDRRSLVQYFAAAGYRTVAVMPAMQRPWPEGLRWGFQEIYRAPDLNYAGPPFGWATMPDQYTLDAVRRAVIAHSAHPPAQPPIRPLFLQYVLISSHGPWEPLPPRITDWDSLGDGSLFHNADITPQRTDITQSYVRSIDYVLRTLGDYINRFVADDALIVVLGDHQPAPLITGPPKNGEGASQAVPIHVISRDPAALAPFADWGFADGMTPSAEPVPVPMEDFRDRFLRAFSPVLRSSGGTDCPVAPPLRESCRAEPPKS